MRAYQITDSFGLDNLKPAKRPVHEPGPRQVLLRMRALALNYRDVLMVRGQYNPRQPLPLVPVSDGVGEVTAIGSDVRRVAVGDRVAPIFAQRWIAGEASPDELRSTLGGPLDGVLREQLLLDEVGLVKVPHHLSDVEAATLPCAGVTAWSALVAHGRLRAGDTVLVEGTGGVSLFALQIAKLHGARVIATSSSDEKLERLTAMGADETVNYRSTPQWGKAVANLTGGRGVDHVVEVAGGDSLAQSLRALRPFGHLSLIGNLAGSKSELLITSILMRNIRVQGIIVGSRATFEAFARAVDQHALHPVVDRVFPFEDAVAAFRHLESGGHFGKVAIQVGG